MDRAKAQRLQVRVLRLWACPPNAVSSHQRAWRQGDSDAHVPRRTRDGGSPKRTEKAEAMMLHLIAQGDVSLPTWAKWTVGAIGALVVILGIVSTALLPALLKIIKQVQEGLRDVRVQTSDAKEKAAEAKGMATVLDSRANAIASTQRSLNEQITQVAQNQVPPNAAAPPAPSPEIIASALKQPENP
jgi:hypothetical protein